MLGLHNPSNVRCKDAEVVLKVVRGKERDVKTIHRVSLMRHTGVGDEVGENEWGGRA